MLITEDTALRRAEELLTTDVLIAAAIVLLCWALGWSFVGFLKYFLRPPARDIQGRLVAPLEEVRYRQKLMLANLFSVTPFVYWVGYYADKHFAFAWPGGRPSLYVVALAAGLSSAFVWRFLFRGFFPWLKCYADKFMQKRLGKRPVVRYDDEGKPRGVKLDDEDKTRAFKRGGHDDD